MPIDVDCPHGVPALSDGTMPEPCSLCVELHHARATIIRQGAEIADLNDILARLRPGEYPRP